MKDTTDSESFVHLIKKVEKAEYYFGQTPTTIYNPDPNPLEHLWQLLPVQT